MAAEHHDGSQRFAALEGWRGLSALLVAVLHFPAASHIHAWALIGNAHLFVDFFFVLSGLVVTHAYMTRLASLADARVMIWRRMARLWPLHVALLAAFVALEISGPVLNGMVGRHRLGSVFDPASSALLEAIPTHLLLLHSFGLHDRLTWNIPSWSIAAEFWAYVVFATAMLLAGRRSLHVAIGLAAGGALVVALGSKSFMAVHFDLGFFRCLYGFFVGHVVYRVGAAGARPFGLASLIEVGCIAAVLAFVSLGGGTALEFGAPLLFGLVIWIFAKGDGCASRVLGARPLRALGTWSYSIYMVHALLVALLHRALIVTGQHVGQPLMVTVDGPHGPANVISFGGPYAMDLLTLGYLALLVLISALTWRWIEMPAQRALNARIGNASQRPLRPALMTAPSPAAVAAPGGEVRLGFRLADRRYFVRVRYGVEHRSSNRLAAEGQARVPVAAVSYVALASILFLAFGLFSFAYLLKSYAGINLFNGDSPLHPLYALFVQ